MADKSLSLDLTINVGEKITHRVRKYKFADGYEQIQKDGINTRITEYAITTKPLTAATAALLIKDLDAVAQGDFFLATLKPFSTTNRRYRLKENGYQQTFMPQSKKSVFTFTLIESFAP